MKRANTVVAFDFRGHGSNTKENPTDLSEQTLIADTVEALRFTASLFPDKSIIMVGHSMGGSIATKTTYHIVNTMSSDSLAK